MANITNDEKMFYDIDKHRYILTPEALAQDYNIQLANVLDTEGSIDPDTVPQMYLNRISMTIYTYIRMYAYDKDEIEYVASLPRFREAIMTAQEELAYGWLMSNTDKNTFFNGNADITVTPMVRSILREAGLLNRGHYYNIPIKYKELRGVEY